MIEFIAFYIQWVKTQLLNQQNLASTTIFNQLSWTKKVMNYAAIHNVLLFINIY